jgi:hypothetical protein
VGGPVERRGPIDLTGVFSVMSGTVADMKTYAAVEILDHVQAFYKVFRDYLYQLSLLTVWVIGGNEDIY